MIGLKRAFQICKKCRIRWRFQKFEKFPYRYSRKSLPFFCSSLTTWPNSIKIGTFIAPGESDSLAKFHLAVFLCCRETAHEYFVKQQKLVKPVKNWTFANGNETNCIGVVLCAECENWNCISKKGCFYGNFGVFTTILECLQIFS